MALPQDGQNANALATVKEVPIGKKLIFVDPDTNEGGIITLEDLTTQILKKLTSQTFALDQGTKTLPAALNELNSNRAFGTLITSEDHDCNNLGFGIFLLLNPKNGVTEINWHVVISANNNGAQTGFQITYDLTDGSKAYTRTQASGTWSNWTSIK